MSFSTHGRITTSEMGPHRAEAELRRNSHARVMKAERLLSAIAVSCCWLMRSMFLWSSCGVAELGLVRRPLGLQPEKRVVIGGNFGSHYPRLRREIASGALGNRAVDPQCLWQGMSRVHEGRSIESKGCRPFPLPQPSETFGGDGALLRRFECKSGRCPNSCPTLL